ncbi:MAG: tetratricopeptide repeat protein [Phycisphaerales bacterium]|nr:tetratricopeptide repeat protein [Phycisphaerales bacterium]
MNGRIRLNRNGLPRPRSLSLVRPRRWPAKWLLPAGAMLVVLLATGCAQQTPQVEARKEATGRWNLARSRVKAQLAADQLAAGNVTDAAAEIERAMALDPANPRLMVLSAKVALARGNDRLAEQLLTGIEAEAPVRAEAEYLLGVIAQQRLCDEKALEHFVRAGSIDPAEVAYPIAVSQQLLQAGDARAALEQLDSRRADFGWTSGYHAARAECLEALGDWREAAAAWRQASTGSKDPAVQERLALALRQSGQWREAASVLEARLADGAAESGAAGGAVSSRVLRLALAECQIESRQFEAARAQIALVMKDDPRDARAWLLLSRIETYGQNFEKALDLAQRSLTHDPDSRAAMETVAGLAYRLGRREVAEGVLARLRAVDPSNAVAAAIGEAR